MEANEPTAAPSGPSTSTAVLNEPITAAPSGPSTSTAALNEPTTAAPNSQIQEEEEEEDEGYIKHVVKMFHDDEMARTCTAPDDIAQLYRLRIPPLWEVDGKYVEDPNPDPNRLYEFLISPQYLKELNDPTFERDVKRFFTQGPTMPYRDPSDIRPVAFRKHVAHQLLFFRTREKANRILARKTRKAAKKEELKRKRQQKQLAKREKREKRRLEKEKGQEKNSTTNQDREITIAELDIGWRKCKVTLKSICSLNAGCFLNDEVLDYGLMYFLKQVQCPYDVLLLPVYAWESYFYIPLASPVPEQKITSLYKLLTKHGQDPDLLKRKYIVVPIIREKHWFLVVICSPFPTQKEVEQCRFNLQRGQGTEKEAHQYICRMYNEWFRSSHAPKILMFDSMKDQMMIKCANYAEFHLDSIKLIMRAIYNMHNKLWKEINLGAVAPSNIFNTNTIEWFPMQVPEQLNKEDCGLLCMSYLKLWFQIITESDGGYMTFYRHDLRGHIPNPVERDFLKSVIRDDCKKNFPQSLEALDKISSYVSLKSEPTEEGYLPSGSMN